MTEEWRRWCLLNGVEPLPAPIAAVQAFVNTIAPLGSKKVWEIVQDISRDHWLKDLADPTVHLTIQKPDDSKKNKPPRAWPADRKARFLELPEDWQQFLAEHDMHRERTVKMAMEAAHDVRTQAGLPKLPKGYYREDRTETAA
jgi:hypothetical protein